MQKEIILSVLFNRKFLRKMHNYQLSIIIPTKNRQYYCLYAIRQILSHGWKQVEICIQDNSDNNGLEDDIKKLGAVNVNYNYHPGVLSFVDNFSEAVSLAHGDYLCMIGDDDGVLPDIIALVQEMIYIDADAAIPELNFIYFWPSNLGIVENGDKGTMVCHLDREFIFHRTRVVNSQKAVYKLLRRGVQNYLRLNIPRLYHGIVKKSALEVIKETTGNYFGGLTPDMYMAIALSQVCNKVIKVNYSVTISGICPKSGSSDSATGKHTGDLNEAPHFRGHNEYKWENIIPSFYSVDTIWADSLFHALRDFQRTDMIRQFNLNLFAGICMEKYPEYRNMILNHAINNNCSISIIRYSLFKYKLGVLIQRVKRKIKKLFCRGIGKNTTHTSNISNISEAEDRVIVIINSAK